MKNVLKLIAFASLFAAFSSISAFSQEKIAPKIAAIHAQLFFEEKGTFSDDLFARENLSLWNTIIGEGSAGGASKSTLITVEVSGKNLKIGAFKIEIIARGYKNKVLGSKTTEIAIYDDKTSFFAPLFLHDTGCDPVKISARLIGKGASAKAVRKTIPFACGE